MNASLLTNSVSAVSRLFRLEAFEKQRKHLDPTKDKQFLGIKEKCKITFKLTISSAR